MEKIMTFENLRHFAYSNDAICKRPIRGVVLLFTGLGFTDMLREEQKEGIRFAEDGILYLLPYNDPWSWMNRQAVAYTDELVDVVMEHFALPENTPIIATGGSMGGLAALVYTAKAKRTPAACVVNCPVCDLPYHFTERDDLPRTLYNAFLGEAGTLEDALKSCSPLHLVEQMPNIPYAIFHCECDQAVGKQMHSDRLVNAMKDRFEVHYHSVPDRGHCDLPDEMWERYFRYITDVIAASESGNQARA